SSARSGPPSPAVSPWPTLAWQWTHRTLSGTSCATIASWQRRQFSWRIRALFSLIWIGSWESWDVEPFWGWGAFQAVARCLAKKLMGRWQSTQVALPWWLDFCQASYSRFMMWQFAQAFGSWLK